MHILKLTYGAIPSCCFFSTKNIAAKLSMLAKYYQGDNIFKDNYLFIA